MKVSPKIVIMANGLLFCTHDQTFDVMLLGDGHQCVDDPAHQMVANQIRQRVEVIFRHHQVMQLRMAGAGGIDAKARSQGGKRRREY